LQRGARSGHDGSVIRVVGQAASPADT